ARYAVPHRLRAERRAGRAARVERRQALLLPLHHRASEAARRAPGDHRARRSDPAQLEKAARAAAAYFFAAAPPEPKSISILLTWTLALALASARARAAVLNFRLPAEKASASRNQSSTSFSCGGFSPGVAQTLAESWMKTSLASSSIGSTGGP